METLFEMSLPPAWYSQIMRGDLSKLQLALNKVGMTQTELAKRIGVERATVSNWINGNRTPTLGHLRKAAEVLGMTVTEILGDEVLYAETKTERDIIEQLREMSEEDREAIARMVAALTRDSEKR